MYNSSFYIYENNKPVKCTVRNYRESDFNQLISIQQECFPPPFPSDLWWNVEQLQNHVTLFPEGALCVEINGELAGSLTGTMISYDPHYTDHTWEEVTGNGYITNHNSDGNAIYIVDISVRPKYRKLGLGKILMQSMYQVVIQLKLERLLGGGRMPGYSKYANEFTPEIYINKVLEGELKDPVISFLLRCGRTPVTVLKNYIEDKESLNHAVLMEWKNPFVSA